MSATPPAFLIDGPADAGRMLVLAHGAGAPMDHPWMEAVAGRIAAGGIRVARFEFPYMARRRHEGVRAPPDRQAVLLASWRAAVEALDPPDVLAIGGKSMGGRMATMAAPDLPLVRGVVVLGYPFHAAGRGGPPRTEHLGRLRVPALFLQGERDPMGRRDEVERYHLPRNVRVRWMTDGDHSLAPRKSSGRTADQNMDEAAAAVVEFIRRL